MSESERSHAAVGGPRVPKTESPPAIGYRKQPSYVAIESAFRSAGARIEAIHTCGHASKPDLLRFAHALGANHLVPIHGFDWDARLPDFPNVVRLADGEPFIVP